jgi:phosphoribosylamine-glycine ligase
MNNQYYMVKGLNKLAQGWHELGEDAVAKSYATINTIRFNEMYYRKDIGKDLLKFKN